MHFEKAQLCHPLLFKKPEGVPGVDWHIFDDHIEIDENVILLDASSFTLKVRPAGAVWILMVRDQDPEDKEFVTRVQETADDARCPDHKKFREYLRSPEAEKIIAAVADRMRVKANRRNLTSQRLHADEIVTKQVSVKHDCPEYQKCLAEFGDNLGWCCSNCGFDPEAPKDNEMVITCELRLNLVKAGRNIAKLFE